MISERTKAVLAAARARGITLGSERGYWPSSGPDARAAARVWGKRLSHRLVLELEAVPAEGVASDHAITQVPREHWLLTPCSDAVRR